MIQRHIHGTSIPQGPASELARGAIEAAVRDCPDRCAQTIGELADRIGIDKLTLIGWARADLQFALLVASKVIS